MPVYTIACPDCGNVSPTLVLAGCQMPSEWVCGACGGRRAQLDASKLVQAHPWEEGHGANCLCCASPAPYVCSAVD